MKQKGKDMAKGKMTSVFFCQECGYESSKWMGQCPGCKAWNTMVEEVVDRTKLKTGSAGAQHLTTESKVCTLSDVVIREQDKVLTGTGELDRVLGGGIVQGSMTLVGGDPGIGKSTLLLQACQRIAEAGHKVLYVSGEESPVQIMMRADRIGKFSKDMLLFCETSLDTIGETIRREKPEVVVIDSIQTMYCESVSAAPGSVSQVREATATLLQLAKGLLVSIFIVGHVTKEGTVAGPRVLEHMVDTVLYFEGDRHASYRILRGVKNRFGSTNEIGVFEMRGSGLVEVKNPSEYMLSGRPENASGSVVTCSMEGTRPLLMEIQGLVCYSNFGIPRRQTTGTDFNRVNLLMAVLEKRSGVQLSGCDAYVNITGGLKVVEPAIDLAIVMAVVSSFRNKALPSGLVAFGEVGLSGEVRGVSQAAQRVAEAEKLGFTVCLLPKANLRDVSKQTAGKIKLIGITTVMDALDFANDPETTT